jgi:hypothetical protein
MLYQAVATGNGLGMNYDRHHVFHQHQAQRMGEKLPKSQVSFSPQHSSAAVLMLRAMSIFWLT